MITMAFIVGGVCLGLLVLALFIKISIKKQEQQGIKHLKRLFAETESYGMDLPQIHQYAISGWKEYEGQANQAEAVVEKIVTFVCQKEDEDSMLAMAALLLHVLLLYKKNIAAVLLKAIYKQQQIDKARLIARILVMTNSYNVRLWNSYIDSTFKDPQLSADIRKEFALQLQK